MIAYFDIFSGISGDMTLGAFVDLGVPLEWLKKQLTAMPLSGFDIGCQDKWCNGIKAADIMVTENESVHPKTYRDIRSLISGAPFSQRVIEQSLTAFKKIAVAESRIHGADLESVHFHEVGGIDALVDIVGSFLCAEYLGITRVHASCIPLGRGFISCSHGVIPVPAPATLAILKGVPVRASGINMEIVTPTGAAIITTLAQEFGAMPDMVVDGVGYGSGKQKSDTGIPNLLRIIIGKPLASGDSSFLKKETVWVVETTIDDMNPEVSGYLMDKLFEAGALDVCHIPLQMKKNRPGTRLEVICHEDRLNDLMNLILTQSSSTGVRFHKVQRGVLHREIVEVPTCFGIMKAKKIVDPTGAVRIVPEYEVCRRVAEEKKIPLRDVYTKVLVSVQEMAMNVSGADHDKAHDFHHGGSKNFQMDHGSSPSLGQGHYHDHDHPHIQGLCHDHDHSHGQNQHHDHGKKQ
ncbi:MAG: nickel pincer cofactor biosynthesis protein LarC [Desulfobacterium sp.]